MKRSTHTHHPAPPRPHPSRSIPLSLSLSPSLLPGPASYFLRNWPHLCFLAFDRAVQPAAGAAAERALPLRAKAGGAAATGTAPPPPPPSADGACIGAVVAKQGPHGRAVSVSRGYIAMLVVAAPYRGRRIGAALASAAVSAAAAAGAAEVVLEADASNGAALALYAGLGFARDKRLARYYLNGADAYRLKLALPEREEGGGGGGGGEERANGGEVGAAGEALDKLIL